MRALSALAALAAVLLAPSAAFAQLTQPPRLMQPDAQQTPAPLTAVPGPSLDRASTLVEVGVGTLSLPKADICLPTAVTCATSDVTLLAHVGYLVRPSSKVAFGAAGALGFRTVEDDTSIDTPAGKIERSHSRNYFKLEFGGRYYLLTRNEFDVWATGAAGLVVISDRFENADKGTAVINPKATSIRTEGLSAGIGLGGEYRLSEALAAGAWTQQMLWFLPSTQSCAVTNECSTVGGRVFTVELGLLLSYRVGL